MFLVLLSTNKCNSVIDDDDDVVAVVVVVVVVVLWRIRKDDVRLLWSNPYEDHLQKMILFFGNPVVVASAAVIYVVVVVYIKCSCFCYYCNIM